MFAGLPLVIGLLAVLVWLMYERRWPKAPSTERPQPPASTKDAGPSNSTGMRAEAACATQYAAFESFGYTISHDLRAPLRVVEGFAKILKEDHGPQLDRIGNDHLDRIIGAATRMNKMIDALLSLSQLSDQPLGHQAVDLSHLGECVAEDLRRQHPEREVSLYIEAGLTAHGDPTLLRVVLENLLGNAWKYTSKRQRAEISLVRNPLSANTYTVHDNGAGFDMRFADRLFELFQRLHSNTDFSGTGVGLASVRRIVKKHGGDVWAEAEVDRGARFHFSLGLPPHGGLQASQHSH